jgi:hypothetical protein
MGFTRRKMEDQRRRTADKEAAARRATEKQILEDADHLVTVWKERQAKGGLRHTQIEKYIGHCILRGRGGDQCVSNARRDLCGRVYATTPW